MHKNDLAVTCRNYVVCVQNIYDYGPFQVQKIVPTPQTKMEYFKHKQNMNEDWKVSLWHS